MASKGFSSKSSYGADSNMKQMRKTTERLLSMGQSMMATLGVLLLAWGAFEMSMKEIQLSQTGADSAPTCLSPVTLSEPDLKLTDLSQTDDQTANIPRLAMGFAYAGVVVLIGSNSPSHTTSDTLYWLQMGGVFVGIFLLAISYLLSTNVIMSHQCVTQGQQSNSNNFSGYAYDQTVGSYSVFIVVIIFGFLKHMIRAYGTSRNPGDQNLKTLANQPENKIPSAGSMVQNLVWQGLSRMSLSVVGLIFGIWLLATWNDEFLVNYNYTPTANSSLLSDVPTFDSQESITGVYWVETGEAVSQHCDHHLGERYNTYSYMIPNLALATLVLSAIQIAMEGALLFLTGWNASQSRNSSYTFTKVVVFLNYWTRLGLQVTIVSFLYTILLSNTTFRHCPLLDLGDQHVRSFVTTASFFGAFFVWSMLIAVNSTFIDIVSKHQRMNMNFGLVGQV